MLVCKAITLCNSIKLLPSDQRMSMLKYLGIIMRKHVSSLDVAMRRKISSLMAAITRPSTQSAENNDATGFETVQGSNEVTGSDCASSKASKGAVDTELKSRHRNSTAPEQKRTSESKQKPQKEKIDNGKLVSEDGMSCNGLW
ncbi:hypothetical protein M514_20514 [Trichuris suis]|uniref:Uncharacterized protein n=1 Tax=Trichuris suis TaxID=68888 RepID=A0A085NCR9_9BILA|nr:hypothetical protein M514_20514 [Trichuris suis]